jgi:hypothetical protein
MTQPVYIKPEPTFRWYPTLRDSWSGPLTLVGAYHHGNPLRESVVRNEAGETMAVRTSELTHVKPNG